MAISNFEQLRTQLRGAPPVTAVVAAAHSAHTLEAVFAARRDGLIRPILIGRREEILALAHQMGESIDPDQVFDAASEEACGAQAVALVRSGQGDMLIKGQLQTGTLLKAAVQTNTGIRVSPVMSHVAVLDVPSYHKLLFITDGGLVIAPTLEEKRHILNNAVEFCHFLGYEQPKAAILCALETVTARMPETQDAAALKTAAQQGDFGSCLAEGPISLDLATDPQAAQAKDYQSPVAGDADILLVPSIAAGNLLSKALYGLAGGQMAGVVLGASVPMTVNSRGATAQEKYTAILICSAMAQKRRS